MQVDVIIPTYRPGSEFGQLISKLQKQEYPIHKIIIIKYGSRRISTNA